LIKVCWHHVADDVVDYTVASFTVVSWAPLQSVAATACGNVVAVVVGRLAYGSAAGS